MLLSHCLAPPLRLGEAVAQPGCNCHPAKQSTFGTHIQTPGALQERTPGRRERESDASSTDDEDPSLVDSAFLYKSQAALKYDSRVSASPEFERMSARLEAQIGLGTDTESLLAFQHIASPGAAGSVISDVENAQYCAAAFNGQDLETGSIFSKDESLSPDEERFRKRFRRRVRVSTLLHAVCFRCCMRSPCGGGRSGRDCAATVRGVPASEGAWALVKLITLPTGLAAADLGHVHDSTLWFAQINWTGSAAFIFYILALGFYLWVRITKTLDLGAYLWYGILILLVEGMGASTTILYGINLLLKPVPPEVYKQERAPGRKWSKWRKKQAKGKVPEVGRPSLPDYLVETGTTVRSCWLHLVFNKLLAIASLLA